MTRRGERVRAYLGSESDHFFLGAFLFGGTLGALAVVTAVWVWQWRAHRGPVLVAALAVGGAASAGVAAGVGAALAHLRYGTIDIDAAPVSTQLGKARIGIKLASCETVKQTKQQRGKQ